MPSQNDMVPIGATPKPMRITESFKLHVYPNHTTQQMLNTFFSSVAPLSHLPH